LGNNVMIPLPLVDQIIEVLEELDVSEYHPLHPDCCGILWALRVKKQKIELRGAYAKILQAADQEEMEQARIAYFLQKQMIPDDEDIPF